MIFHAQNIQFFVVYMGHADIALTLSTYTHPEQLDKALFFDGSRSDDEKLDILRVKYHSILNLDFCTCKNVVKKNILVSETQGPTFFALMLNLSYAVRNIYNRYFVRL